MPRKGWKQQEQQYALVEAPVISAGMIDHHIDVAIRAGVSPDAMQSLVRARECSQELQGHVKARSQEYPFWRE